jgi:hypothetical protein
MKYVPTVITRSVARRVLVTKTISPHIFFAAGVVGIVASTVLACRATLKLEKTLDEIKEDFTSVRTLSKIDGSETTLKDNGFDTYPDKAIAKDTVYIYGKAAGKIATLYGPAAILGSASIGLLTGSHVQLTRRNAALTFTLAAVSKAYEAYRERVQEEVGTDRELELFRDIHEEIVEMDGHKQKSLMSGGTQHSPYARVFDEYCINWCKNPEMNRNFLHCQQNYFNQQLKARGHVFLNEVYDAIGLERSQAGQLVGWVTDGNGDGYIDFGMFDGSEKSRLFVNGYEPSIWLDFNVDGVIHDLIERK